MAKKNAKKMNQDDFKIDFIGVGAPKCGTSWTAKCLREHPQICLSNNKELDFFNKFRPFYRKDEEWKYTKGIDEYKKNFRHCKPGNIIGEFSVYYLFDKDTPKLIKKHFPETKIIAILRNPTDRLYSHYLHAKGNYEKKYEKKFFSFDHFLNNDEIISTGFYMKHINNYLNFFDKDKILLLLHDDLKVNPEKFIKRIYIFLDVDKNFTPSLLNYVPNPTWKKNNKTLKTYQKIKNNLMQSSIKKRVMPIIKNNTVNNLALNTLKFCDRSVHSITSLQKRPQLSPKYRKIINDIYREENKKLEKFLNRKLNWDN
ncbi:MAG: hypothetical protein GF349_02035 [Candidatus Magasanikbacteria bacterium]|nr:hypothetical protein [Candidatus Magasanikbacteria bacterium]